MNVLALCAGIAGLELGLQLALGRERVRTVCYVEREAYAVSVLVARMEDGCLDEAPIWSDITTFDGRPWRGYVDLITAGFPCQPFSAAGKRLGLADERWIWPDIARIIREVGPRLVFLENVPGLALQGLGHVLGSLAESGLDAEWGVFSAAGIGAPHRRARLFILAYSARNLGNAEDSMQRPQQESCGIVQQQAGTRGSDQTMANADIWGLSIKRGSKRKSERARWDEFDRCGDSEPLADAQRAELREQSGWRSGESRIGSPFPPGPGGDWIRWLEEHPGTEPAIRRDANGVARRVDRLRATGNGVVPLVVARAFRVLGNRFK